MLVICRYCSEHNTHVKEYLVDQIKGKYQEKCSPARMNSKCHNIIMYVVLCMCIIICILRCVNLCSHNVSNQTRLPITLQAELYFVLVLSRCFIFCQQPAKVTHLSAGRVVCVCICCCAVKMFHLLSATCQDDPSFGRQSCMCLYLLFGLCAVKMFHLLSATCQDDPSFDRQSCIRVCLCYVWTLYCQGVLS